MTATIPVAVKEDFTGQNLRNKDLSHRKYDQCTFDRADMSWADCTGSSFVGCSFVDTICYRTCFKDANLGATQFQPADCYGMTITLTCQTFQSAHVSQMWFYAWLLFLTAMTPAPGPVKEDLKGKLIELIGAVRYVKLKELFARRNV